MQFEVVPDSNLKQRLVQLDKLLRLLPRKLPGLRSKVRVFFICDENVMSVASRGQAQASRGFQPVRTPRNAHDYRTWL